MRKTLAILLTCAFAFGGFAACGDPCEKAANKLIECMGKDSKELKAKLEKEKKSMIEECKKKGEGKKLKKCIGESDCKKFMECLEKSSK